MTPENIQEMYSAIKADPDGDGELLPLYSSVPVIYLLLPGVPPGKLAPFPHSRQPLCSTSIVARDEEVRSQLCPSPLRGRQAARSLGDSLEGNSWRPCDLIRVL
jgi:hypothetical protein